MNEELMDVVICGGGLAGLGLGIQLLRHDPSVRVTVVERARHPVPEAAFKVGESTVEIGAHYLARVLGFEQHIKDDQLPKLGLRYFFTSDDNHDITSRFEMGGNVFYPTPSYQLDRGRLENYMGGVFKELGGIFADGARIVDAVLGEGADSHTLTMKKTGGERSTIQARWLVDASGRTFWLKSRLGLEEHNGHHANAVWFRIKDRIQLDAWSDDTAWAERVGAASGRRWLSTNHLMGEGYWVWLIPLSSGSTSVGIVADADIHPYETMNSFEKALGWLDHFEPQCAEVVHGKQDLLEDFIGYEDYSYGCRQVFSGDRWCLTGEAGLFLDPFYSPGSDLIAMSNTFVADLVHRERKGERVQGRALAYDSIYQQFVARHLTLYKDQYRIMGHARAMACKVFWDFAYYWSVPAFLFFHGKLCDLEAYAAWQDLLDEADRINQEVQALFNAWSHHDAGRHDTGFLDVTSLPFMWELNRQLSQPLAEDELESCLKDNVRLLGDLKDDLALLSGAEELKADAFKRIGPAVEAFAGPLP